METQPNNTKYTCISFSESLKLFDMFAPGNSLFIFLDG